MENITPEQIYNILINLTNLEISYLEYSRSAKNFVKFKPYFEYLNNYVIRSNRLFRFYFPSEITVKESYMSLADMEEIDERIIAPGYDFSLSKQFNFPNAPRHKCSYFNLIYSMKGETDLVLDEKSFRLKKGDFFLLPPGIYYSLTPVLDGICVFFNIKKSFVASDYKYIFMNEPVINNFITNSLSADKKSEYLPIHTNGNNDIHYLILTIFSEYINRKRYSQTAMKSYLSLLFTTILRDDATLIEAPVKATKTERQYEKILNYLKHYYQTADLSSVSQHFNFSKQYICRIVKDVSGKTFNSLLMEIRLAMVKQYLDDSDLTIDNISSLCGFAAASHLSRAFKEHFGILPSEYRKAGKSSKKI